MGAESYARMTIFPAEKLICRLATYLCCAGSCLAGCIAACKYISVSSLRTNSGVPHNTYVNLTDGNLAVFILPRSHARVIVVDDMYQHLFGMN